LQFLSIIVFIFNIAYQIYSAMSSNILLFIS
jgi:hypothetical protein